MRNSGGKKGIQQFKDPIDFWSDLHKTVCFRRGQKYKIYKIKISRFKKYFRIDKEIRLPS